MQATVKEVPDGFVLLQRLNGKAVYAACLNGSRFHGWLMWKHPDGQWVSQRKLESWEIMQAEDQRDDNIIHETTGTEGAQKAPEEVRESATDKAIQRACRDLPDGYEVVIELENGAGGAVWIDEHGERHIIEGEGHISDDINEAIDRALEHAAPDALRTSSTDQANADTGSAA